MRLKILRLDFFVLNVKKGTPIGVPFLAEGQGFEPWFGY